MNGVACLTMNEQLDGSWVWQAYDKQGRSLLKQDQCDDLAHSMECAARAIASIHPPGAEPAPARPAPEAKQPRPRRKQRKRG